MLVPSIRLGDLTYLCSDSFSLNILEAILLFLFPSSEGKGIVLIIFVYSLKSGYKIKTTYKIFIILIAYSYFYDHKVPKEKCHRQIICKRFYNEM